jgi:type II secretory pathway component GspD/PulD (secretin)
MRALLVIASTAVVVVAVSVGIAQEPQPGGASRLQRGPRAAAPQPPQPGRLISVEVVIADVTGEAGEMTAERLAELEKAGQVKSLSRLRVSTLENAPSMVQFGERVSVVTGHTSFGGRGSQNVTAQENLGTMVSVTARVDQDDSILMEFQAEQTRLAPTAARAEGENADRPAELPRTTTIATKSTLRIPQGKSVVAGSKTMRTPQGMTHTWILVSAHAEAAAPEAESVLKIMALKHAQGEAIAGLLAGVFPTANYRVAVDARTNSLIISGSPAVLEKVVPLIAELDQAKDEAAR